MLLMSANVIASAVVLLGSFIAPSMQEPARPAAAAAAKVPDTPAGKALTEFVASFNAGGDKRRAWVEERTTIGEEGATGILQQDAQFLTEYGVMTIVRVVSSSAGNIVAIVRHAKNDAHGHLTLDVDTAAPNKITNMQLRGATPEEIKGL